MKHKWKNLRDSYTKYLKFLKGFTGSAKKYQNWPWAAHLEFLKDTVVPRSMASNVLQIPETSHNDEAYEQDETDGELPATNTSQMQPPTKEQKQKKVTNYVAAVINYLENKKTKLIQNLNTPIISSCHTRILLRNFRQEHKLYLKWSYHSCLDELTSESLTLILQINLLQCSLQLRLGQMAIQTELMIQLLTPCSHSTILTCKQA